jgi:hypothetical protein
MMNFQLGVNGIGTTLATRSWNIKVNELVSYNKDYNKVVKRSILYKVVFKKCIMFFHQITQISCLDANLAPDSCTQYFTAVTGTLNSYNWAGSYQLANQRQNICVR